MKNILDIKLKDIFDTVYGRDEDDYNYRFGQIDSKIMYRRIETLRDAIRYDKHCAKYYDNREDSSTTDIWGLFRRYSGFGNVKQEYIRECLTTFINDNGLTELDCDNLQTFFDYDNKTVKTDDEKKELLIRDIKHNLFLLERQYKEKYTFHNEMASENSSIEHRLKFYGSDHYNNEKTIKRNNEFIVGMKKQLVDMLKIDLELSEQLKNLI